MSTFNAAKLSATIPSTITSNRHPHLQARTDSADDTGFRVEEEIIRIHLKVSGRDRELRLVVWGHLVYCLQALADSLFCLQFLTLPVSTKPAQCCLWTAAVFGKLEARNFFRACSNNGEGGVYVPLFPVSMALFIVMSHCYLCFSFFILVSSLFTDPFLESNRRMLYFAGIYHLCIQRL